MKFPNRYQMVEWLFNALTMLMIIGVIALVIYLAYEVGQVGWHLVDLLKGL